jgi:hypothetical protein
MCEIQDNTRSNSSSDSSGKNGNSGNDCENFAQIRLANTKVKLIDVMRNYGLKIEMNSQKANWSNNITCPFSSHKGAKERTPSFGYNFKTKIFHCFGCGSSGQSVEFISQMEGVPRHEVVDKILSQYGCSEDELDYREYQDDISPLLLDCSNHLQKLIQENKTNTKFLKKADKLIWWLDFYIDSKSQNKKLTAEDLKHRVEKVKELLIVEG